MRSPILLSLTVSVSITVASSAMAQSLRPNIEQVQPQAEFNPVPGAFYSGPNPYQMPAASTVPAATSSQVTPASPDKIINTSKAIIDASKAISDLTDTLNTAPPGAPVDEEATAAAQAALDAVQGIQTEFQTSAESAIATPSPVEAAVAAPAPVQTPVQAPVQTAVAQTPEVQVTTGSEAPPQPSEQINPWRVPNTAKVYDDTGKGVVTKTQELIQSLGIDQQVIATPAQAETPYYAAKPVAPTAATPLASETKSPVPVFSVARTGKPASSVKAAVTTPIAVAPSAVPASVPVVAPVKPAVAAAPVAEPAPIATASAPVAEPIPSKDPGTPVYDSVETASSGAPVPFNETASLIAAPPATTPPAAALSAPVATPTVASFTPIPKVEAAKKPARAPVQVAARSQPVAQVEKPVVARREFPSVRGAFAKLGKPPLLVSRLRTWSTTPVEDWSDPSAVSTEKISPRKGIENVGKKIATFRHPVKNWGGKSNAQTDSQIATRPPVEKQEATTAAPAVVDLERINASGSSSPKATPDTPSTWY